MQTGFLHVSPVESIWSWWRMKEVKTEGAPFCVCKIGKWFFLWSLWLSLSDDLQTHFALAHLISSRKGPFPHQKDSHQCAEQWEVQAYEFCISLKTSAGLLPGFDLLQSCKSCFFQGLLTKGVLCVRVSNPAALYLNPLTLYSLTRVQNNHITLISRSISRWFLDREVLFYSIKKGSECGNLSIPFSFWGRKLFQVNNNNSQQALSTWSHLTRIQMKLCFCASVGVIHEPPFSHMNSPSACARSAGLQLCQNTGIRKGGIFWILLRSGVCHLGPHVALWPLLCGSLVEN